MGRRRQGGSRKLVGDTLRVSARGESRVTPGREVIVETSLLRRIERTESVERDELFEFSVLAHLK